jgi:hypothetical protein
MHRWQLFAVQTTIRNMVSFAELLKNDKQHILLKYAKLILTLRGQFENHVTPLLFVGHLGSHQ